MIRRAPGRRKFAFTELPRHLRVCVCVCSDDTVPPDFQLWGVVLMYVRWTIVGSAMSRVWGDMGREGQSSRRDERADKERRPRGGEGALASCVLLALVADAHVAGTREIRGRIRGRNDVYWALSLSGRSALSSAFFFFLCFCLRVFSVYHCPCFCFTFMIFPVFVFLF